MTHGPAQGGPVGFGAVWQLVGQAGRGPIFQLLALAVLQALLPLAGLFAMRALVDAVADGLAGRTPTGFATEAALTATGVAAAVALLGGLCRSLAAVTAENHGRRLADAGVERLQQQTAARELAAFDRPAFHDALQRASAEAGQRPVRLTQDGIALVVALLGLVSMAAVLATVEPWLPLVAGLTAAPIAWSRRRHARLSYAWHKDHVVEQRELGYLGAVLTGRATAKDVRVLGLAAPFGARLCALRERLRGSLARLARRRALDELWVHALASAGLFSAYVYLAYDALGGGVTLGGLVLHAQAAQRTQNGVRDLLSAWTGVTEHRLFLRPLVDFLAEATGGDGAARTVEAGGAEVPAGALGFSLRDLRFRYPEAPRDALSVVELDIPRGARVALVGHNGSGKSTLIKLLCGLYPPTHGALCANGIELPHVDRAAWRQRLAVLLQDAHGFELSLRDNLQLGNDATPDDDALWRALAVVGLEARVRALPLGLDTPWSRRLAGGVEWSVGEARRLALARALLQPADALLLDEPFASLDGATAASVARHLATLPRERTLVLVDHRGPALGCVDTVVWLRHGEVHATGSPAELSSRADFAAAFPEWRG